MLNDTLIRGLSKATLDDEPLIAAGVVLVVIHPANENGVYFFVPGSSER